MPRGRTDLAVGAAVRVPVGDLASEPMLAEVSPGGVAPSGFVRHGLGPDADLGAEISGTSARAMLRGQLGLDMVRLVGGIAPHVGLAHSGGELVRVGGTVPITLAIDLFSLYEVWIGARVAVEHLTGSAQAASISMTGLRTGGVVGMAVGFRWLWVLVELGVDHELWTGSVSDISIERNGLVLTPAFAVRVRM